MKTEGMPEVSGVPGATSIPMADVPPISRKWLDVVYAHTSPAQQMDIYLPEAGDGPFPVLFYMHGGGFHMGDKRDIYLASYLSGLGRGYAVASVNYRLSGEAVFPAAIQDVKAALRWLRANGGRYSLDTNRVAACGQSSGGNFAAMMCVTAGVAMFEDPALGNAEQSSGVQAGFDWYGPTDFLAMDAQLAASGLGHCDHSEPGSPESRYLGAPIADVPEKVAQANPMTYVNEGMAPILIQHGLADCGVPVEQSIEFARVIEERVGPERFELDLFDGARHDDPIFTSPQNLDRVFKFLDRFLK
jgi:acetyl esterase/lipase